MPTYYELRYNHGVYDDATSTQIGLSPAEEAMRELMEAVRSGAHHVEFDEYTECPSLVLVKVTTDDRGVIIDTTVLEDVDLEKEKFFKDKMEALRVAAEAGPK